MAPSVSPVQPPCQGRVLCQKLCAWAPADYYARCPHRSGTVGSDLPLVSLSPRSQLVEQLALPTLLGRRRPINRRSLSLPPAALRLLGRLFPTIQFSFPLLWLRRQHLGPGHAIQPARPAARQGISCGALFVSLRTCDDGQRDESSNISALPLCLRREWPQHLRRAPSVPASDCAVRHHRSILSVVSIRG